MSVQSVSNSNNQYVNPLITDFKTIQDDIKALETAQSSNNQDKITLSQDALQKAMTQFQNDIASLTQAIQNHRHHHHHNMDATDTSASGSDATGNTVSSVLPSDSLNGLQPQSNASTISLTV